MTSRRAKDRVKDKVTLTLDHDLLVRAEQAVAAGQARSVSAYINDAARRGAFVAVGQATEEFVARFGDPGPEHYAWARAALGLPADAAPPARGTRTGGAGAA